MGRQWFSHCQESRASSCVSGTRDDKHHDHKCSPFLRLSMRFFWLSKTSCGMEYPFGHLGSAVPAVPLPTSCVPPAYLLGGQSVRKRKLSCFTATAQQCLKRWCVTSAALVTNPKLITTWSAVKRTNCIPVGSRVRS